MTIWKTIRKRDYMLSGLEMDQLAKIKVIGIGGGGGNAINKMVDSQVKGVDFIVANTDRQALNSSKAQIKIQLGKELTAGLGAGGKPEIGREAAIESKDEIKEAQEALIAQKKDVQAYLVDEARDEVVAGNAINKGGYLFLLAAFLLKLTK